MQGGSLTIKGIGGGDAEAKKFVRGFISHTIISIIQASFTFTSCCIFGVQLMKVDK